MIEAKELGQGIDRLRGLAQQIEPDKAGLRQCGSYLSHRDLDQMRSGVFLVKESLHGLDYERAWPLLRGNRARSGRWQGGLETQRSHSGNRCEIGAQ
jgi:hypothetical protein